MNYSIGLALVWMMVYASGCLSQTGNEPQVSGGNPLEFNVTNIRRGKQFFTMHCVSCHGTDGRGDTEMREFLKTPPADLTDDQWTYTGADDAVFDVVKQGRTARDMPAFAGQLSDERIWQVVGYVNYLGGRRP